MNGWGAFMTNLDTITIGKVGAQPVPPVMPRPQPVAAEGVTPERRGRQQDSRRESGSNAAQFRTLLDAATFAGMGQTAGGVSDAPAAAARVYPTTITRTPARTQELNGQDAMELYRATRRPAPDQRADAVESEFVEADDDAPRAAHPHEARRVAGSYAQRFFSVGGTFAARGETLELST
jgi:hypothetical protein